MFKKARLKLTAWYLTIIMAVTIAFSLFVYHGVNEITMRALETQKRRLEKQLFMVREMPGIIRGNPMIDTETILEIRENTKDNLIAVNLIVFVVAGSLGYFLAGKTLKPIEEMVNKQKRFISDAAHEIKTPLTAMKTTLEVTVRDRSLKLEDSKEAIKSAIEEIDKLHKLTTNLLKQSKYQNDEHIEDEEIEIDKLLLQIIEKLTPIATQKNIALINHLHKVKVNSSKTELEELFTNLIDNAIKYNEKNGEVSITSKEIHGKAYITIEDTGKGIKEDDLPYIFEPFYRADTSRTNSQQDGYGLGLAISKEIVERYKGEIKIESAIKKGTLVTVKFPLSNNSVERKTI